MKKIKFLLDGCDISFVAQAPEDITLKQLLEQCDKIYPEWCCCGIQSLERANFREDTKVELDIDYKSIKKISDDVSCTIKENWKDEE